MLIPCCLAGTCPTSTSTPSTAQPSAASPMWRNCKSACCILVICPGFPTFSIRMPSSVVSSLWTLWYLTCSLIVCRVLTGWPLLDGITTGTWVSLPKLQTLYVVQCDWKSCCCRLCMYGLSNVLICMLAQGDIQLWRRLSRGHDSVCRLLQEPHKAFKTVSTVETYFFFGNLSAQNHLWWCNVV